MQSRTHKIKIRTILGFCMSVLSVFIVNTKAQIQELNPYLQKQVLKEIEITGRFNTNINTIRNGEPLTLILTIKNNSKSPISFVDSFAIRDYKITVRNERGGIVSLTEYGERMKNQTSVWRNLIVKLEPGKKSETRVGLDKIYDITSKGKYYISVSRQITVNPVVQEQKAVAQVASKEIQFIVN